MESTDNNSAYDMTTDILASRLNEHVEGGKELSLDEIIKIKSALAADRPVANAILTTIFNEFSFLHRVYEIKTNGDFTIIMDFLEAFLTYTQQELLAKEGTFKDGIALQKVQNKSEQE